MNERMERKVYPNRIEYIYYPFTEEEAKKADWPCEMCEHILWVPSSEENVCRAGRCQSLNRRVKGLKPLNFELQTSHLLCTCRRGIDTNRVAMEEEQRERTRRRKNDR